MMSLNRQLLLQLQSYFQKLNLQKLILKILMRGLLLLIVLYYF